MSLNLVEQGVGMRGDLERGREREEFRCGVILGFSQLQSKLQQRRVFIPEGDGYLWSEIQREDKRSEVKQYQKD